MHIYLPSYSITSEMSYCKKAVRSTEKRLERIMEETLHEAFNELNFEPKFLKNTFVEKTKKTWKTDKKARNDVSTIIFCKIKDILGF